MNRGYDVQHCVATPSSSASSAVCHIPAAYSDAAVALERQCGIMLRAVLVIPLEAIPWALHRDGRPQHLLRLERPGGRAGV